MEQRGQQYGLAEAALLFQGDYGSHSICDRYTFSCTLPDNVSNTGSAVQGCLDSGSPPKLLIRFTVGVSTVVTRANIALTSRLAMRHKYPKQ